MALSQRLDVRQSQQLVMTPQLQQAIKLLQLSHLELNAFVETELEQNPLLERGDPDERVIEGEADPFDLPDPREAQPAPATRAEDADFEPADSMDLANAAGLQTGDGPLDTDYENVYTNAAMGEIPGNGETLGSYGNTSGRSDFSDDEFSLERTLSRPETLREHLEQQMAVDLASPVDRAIALGLTDLLDASGYLVGDTGELALRLGCTENKVLEVLEVLQRFDPPGIFARSLKECLTIQLAERNRLDPYMHILLDNLELLGRRDVNALLKAIGCTQEDLTDMVAEIRALNPRPANDFDFELPPSVSPDILMRRAPNGSWIIELNPETLPRVLVNQRYYAEVTTAATKGLNKADKDYVNDRWQSANWLVKSLHQRATTIMKVSREIVRQQESFFDHGVTHLRPLILRNIAEAIEMHESTVSRVTTNKFIATPRGIFELKYFFTAAIQGSGGQANHSAESVRHRIKALIDQEVPANVLSDDQIVATLRAEGVDIARRTVAKYREAMNIPSSVERRKRKALTL
jgi:RNA polymerase sigma-54 factor